MTNPEGKTFKFDYDADGRRVSLGYPNGVQAVYAYDAASQLTQITHMLGSSLVAFSSYTYDTDGNRLSMGDFAPDNSGPETHSYGYDALNRLTSASHPAATNLPILSETFSYDAVGNRLSDAQISGYQYDAANRLTANSSFTYTYDNNGNRLSAKNSANQTTSFVYDSANELIQASMPSGTATYAYDAFGRRVERSSNTAAGQPIYYVYDMQDILAEVDGAGDLIALFTHGPGIDEPLEIQRGDGTDYFLHADGLGSIMAVTSSTGGPVERGEYEAYGSPVFIDVRASPTIEAQSFTGSPYAFTARPFDPETGLYYNNSRYRDPVTGGFISPDPLGVIEGGDVDIYSYVLDQPTNWVDPNGTQVVSPRPPPLWAPPRPLAPGNRPKPQPKKPRPAPSQQPIAPYCKSGPDTSPPPSGNLCWNIGEPSHQIITKSPFLITICTFECPNGRIFQREYYFWRQCPPFEEE